MSKLLNKSEYDVSYDKLIASNKHPLDVKVVSVVPGDGLKRGTVLSLVEASGVYGVFGSSAVSAGNANCIVADDVEAGSDAVGVTVYVSGCFNEKALAVAELATLDTKAIEDLRSKGIFVE